MNDGLHRHPAGAEPGRFATGPRERLRTKFGTGELLPTNLTDEGAKDRCSTATGPAVRQISDASNERRKRNPRSIRVEEVRVHHGPAEEIRPALGAPLPPLGED